MLGLRVERGYFAHGLKSVAGVDEAGRGPLAGPVVAAAVLVAEGTRLIRGVDDSKVMTQRRREKIAAAICSRLRYAVGAASVREIDRLNIRRASALAMHRALARLGAAPDVIIIDGLPLPELGFTHEAMVDGDAKSFSIACASIVAKTVRDRLMGKLAVRYPAYHWEKNAGYGTADHLSAIQSVGVTPHHRRSFTPVVQRELFS
ncbi:MAG: ribonuclease HII [Gemmatimonadales bacterium]